jgi:ketosteroid isomerase-like protein
VALFCTTLNGQAASPASSAGLEQEIARLEKGCNDAYAANNLPKYFSYYADDAVLIFINERTTVPAYRKMWTEEIKTKPLESVKLTDMVIRVMPAADAAIASYQIEIRTHQPGGKLTDEKFFETDVWVHKGDAWKLVHVQFSAIPPK